MGFCMQAFKLVKCEYIQFIDTIDHMSAPVQMTAHLCVQLHVCACMCLETRGQSQLLFPKSCLSEFLRQFVTGWSQLGRLGCLASDPRHLPTAGSAVLELTNMHHHTWLIFMQVLGAQVALQVQYQLSHSQPLRLTSPKASTNASEIHCIGCL